MADDDQDERHYHGPYKMTMFEPWNNFGTEAITDLDSLYDDLARWERLCLEGQSATAAREIGKMLIEFRNSKSPITKMLEANTRFAARMGAK